MTEMSERNKALWGHITSHPVIPHRDFAPIAAAPPFLQGVKAKDLRWKGPDSSGEHHALNGLWGYIIRCGNGNGYWLTEIGQYYPTPEAAKSAAQADYEDRILSAIEVAPSPRAQALEEAARNLIANRFDSYKARNGKLCSIEGDDGEKCWIVSFDDMAELESALSSQPVANGHKGEWREIEISQPLKGRRVSPAYFPVTGEVCEVSGPNCDDDKGYTWGETTVLWQNEMFVLYGKNGYWPVLHKHEHVLFRPLPASPGASE